MPVLLLLIIVLVGGSAYANDIGHIADVIHPNQRIAQARPTPPPEPDVTSRPTPASEPSPAQNTQPTAATQPQPQSQPLSEESTPALQDEWVLQVGAFDNYAAAEAGLQRIGHAGLKIAYTYRNREDWYVLLLGPYPNRGQAERAGEAFTESTGGEYWVRPASAVRPPKN